VSTDNILTTIHQADWRWGLAIAAVVLLLVLLARLLRRARQSGAAAAVTSLATTLGLGWSAQGMWDTAVHSYDQGPWTASVLFIVFEAWLLGRMLRAHQYRGDRPRRARFVAAVWTGAIVMAVVVATGEGWSQAPGRLAIPLLVAYGWYTDLTADDDPAEQAVTSWRWTPRRVLLALGAIEPGKRDAHTIDRARHVKAMRDLAFRIGNSHPLLNDALRRRVRLAKLELAADDEMIRAARADLSRIGTVLQKSAEPEPRETHPVMPPQPVEPERVRPAKPAESEPQRRVQGVHTRVGRTMRGDELEADAVAVHRKSMSTDRPRGMTAAELAALYEPALGMRKAEEYAAKSRRQINGSVPALDLPGVTR
jgi:hypothetical protein